MRAHKHLSSHLYAAFPYMTQLFFHFLVSEEDNNFTRMMYGNQNTRPKQLSTSLQEQIKQPKNPTTQQQEFHSYLQVT